MQLYYSSYQCSHLISCITSLFMVTSSCARCLQLTGPFSNFLRNRARDLCVRFMHGFIPTCIDRCSLSHHLLLIIFFLSTFALKDWQANQKFSYFQWVLKKWVKSIAQKVVLEITARTVQHEDYCCRKSTVLSSVLKEVKIPVTYTSIRY